MFNLLTCADSNYFPLALGLARNVRRFPRCRLFLYDLGLTAAQQTLLRQHGVQIESAVFDPNTFQLNSKHNIRNVHKINCIEDFLRRYGQGVVVLDSDVLLINDVAEDLWPEGNQVVVTRRCLRECKPHILINGKINSGVMAFGPMVDHAFFQAWRALCENREHTDQSALSTLIEPYLDWDALGQLQQGPGCTIRLLDGNIYNDVTCRSGKIFHFKNAGRQGNKRLGYAVFSVVQRLLPGLVSRLIGWNRKHGWYIWKP